MYQSLLAFESERSCEFSSSRSTCVETLPLFFPFPEPDLRPPLFPLEDVWPRLLGFSAAFSTITKTQIILQKDETLCYRNVVVHKYFLSQPKVSLNFVGNTVKHGNKVLLSYQCKRKKRIIRFNRYIKYSKKLTPSGLERKKK